MPNAMDVARYILATQGGIPGERITNLKLQKLLYYSQGYQLALNGRALFPEEIRAWGHGPVVPDVWRYYRSNRANPLPKPARAPEGIAADEREGIDSLIQSYGQYTAWRLRELTHQESPWVDAYNRGGGHSAISLDTMQAFFRAKL